MTIDFDKPIETIDGKTARLITRDIKGGYPFLVAYTEDGYDYETTACVDEDGDSEDHSGLILNVREEVQADGMGAVVLPSTPALRVHHAKRGYGTIKKTRVHDTRSFGVLLDSGAVPGDGGLLWALNKNLRAAA